jgi:Tol biopolymer transport system component
MRRRIALLLAACCPVFAFTAVASPADATYPGTDGLITFNALVDEVNQLFTVDRNGHGLHQITNVSGSSDIDPGDAGATRPDWSPDGRRITFSLNQCRIALVHPDGSGLHTIDSQTPGGCETDSVFTPDGEHLVLEIYNPATDDDATWIMSLDGSDRRRLGAGPNGGVCCAEVSPDGRTVTFLSASEPDGPNALFALSIDGGDAHQIGPTLNGIQGKFSWAPDGSRLLMSDNAERPDLPVNLLTIRPDGSGLRYLTDLRSAEERALPGGYSPDGKWIVYRLEHGNQYALMITRVDGHGTHTVALLVLQAVGHQLGPISEIGGAACCVVPTPAFRAFRADDHEILWTIVTFRVWQERRRSLQQVSPLRQPLLLLSHCNQVEKLGTTDPVCARIVSSSVDALEAASLPELS